MKKTLLFVFIFISIGLVSAGLNINGEGDSESPSISMISKTDPATLNLTSNISFTSNSSDFWDDLDTINNTQMENSDSQLNIKESWLTTFGNTIWCALTGCTMTGNLTTTQWFNGKFNWTTGDNYNSFDGSTLTFNKSKFETTYYNATSISVITGTPQGDIGDLQSDNNIPYNLSEVASDLELRINFSVGVGGDFTTLIIDYRSEEEDEPHIMLVQFWDYDDEVWEDHDRLVAIGTYVSRQFGIYDSSRHVGDDGVVQIRLYQDEGVPAKTHKHNFDWIILTKGYGTPTGEETDPFSWHRGSNGEDGNFSTSGNVNATFFNGFNLTESLANHPHQDVKTTASPTFNNLITTGKLGIGSDTLPSIAHIYENTANTGATAGLTIENAGSGDAILHFKLPAVDWSIGADNTGEVFRISKNVALGTSKMFTIDLLGNMNLNTDGFEGGGKFSTKGKSGSDVVTDIFNAILDRGAGVGGVGFGLGYNFQLENGAGLRHDAGRFEFVWSDATATSETSKYVLKTMSDGSFVDALTVIGANVELLNDNSKLNFGITNTDLQISSDGTNPVYNATGVHTFYNASGLGTIRAGRYITGSYAPDISSSENSFLDKLKNINNWINQDKSINYSSHYAYAQTIEKDPNNCWDEINYYCWEEQVGNFTEQSCSKILPKEIKDYEIIYREECGTRLADGLDLEKRAGDMEGMIWELKQENELLKSELCLKDMTYKFC